MSVTYHQCEADVANRLARVMEKYHTDLASAEVKVDLLFASDEDGPAVALHGYPCAAVVRKVSYKHRVLGHGDAEIVIDHQYWEDANERARDALLSHELTHLELTFTKAGALKKDRAGRPKLNMKLHDWQLGGFASTAENFKADAPEVQMARHFREKFGQLCFDFATKKS